MDVLHSTQTAVMSAKNVTSQNIIQYSMYKPMISYVMLMFR